jgi:8-oxo-(d)GTP phosphatase
MTDRPRDGQIRAAGAVVWRPAASGAEVALIHRSRYGGDWTFPKGKREPGEHILATAVREVAEETGLEVVLGRPLGSSRYHSVGHHGAGRAKRVDYWAGRCLDPQLPFAPNDEADQLDWLDAAAARGRLTYPRDVERLDAFTAGPAETVPLILLRHAEAGRRADWPGEDLDRPLDADGARAAIALAGVLRCLGPRRVISSAALRCVATVRPYAEISGVPVQTEPAFTAGPRGAGQAAAGRAADWAMDRAAALAADGIPTVICTHRENLPLLLEAACGRLGAGPPRGPALGKGDFWVLQSAGGALVSAERHGPPGRA